MERIAQCNATSGQPILIGTNHEKSEMLAQLLGEYKHHNFKR
jgi:preprotein translocase subunit SecA